MPTTTKPGSPDTIDRLDVIAACPECGGQNAWKLLQTLRSCDYCGSGLWWPREPGRAGFLVAEDAVEGPEALLDVLQTLDAMRERSRLAGIRADLERASGETPIDRSDDPTLPSVSELKAERRHLFSLDAHHKVLAPYVLFSSTLTFHALGRPRGGVKEFRNLFFRLEEIAPGYQPPWNFRDRGLWVAKQRLRAIAPEDLAVRPIARADHAVELEPLAARYRGQRLLIQPDLEPITFDSNLAAPSRWWVYRPFYYVRARTPMRDGWFLVDGQFATVDAGPHASLLPTEWSESWLPAFEALTVARYDAWAFEWAAALTRLRPERCERRFFREESVDKANRVVPCAIAWENIRPLFPRLLLELLPKPVQARLNPMVIKKILAATIDVSTVGLVFVPAPVMKDGDRRVLGPSSSVGWVPLRDGTWPPDLQRDVRRALERGKQLEQPSEPFIVP